LGHVLHTVQGQATEAATAIPIDALRRVIPISQVVAAITYCHADATGHRGQDATLHRVNQLFDGLTRPLVRECVKRCPTCQLKAHKQFKAKLNPIIAPQLFDRLLIDLIDKRRQPDRGYHYIMHVADHHSRYHFIRPLRTKQASSVADELCYVLADIGGCHILQSDQGPEFKGEVTALCERFGIQQVRSSPYTPSTNGLVEKWNHVIKVGIAAWQAENDSNAWVACLPQLQVQMNSTWTRSLQCTPYELVFGQLHRFIVKQVIGTAQIDHLDNTEWEANSDTPEAPRQPPSSLQLYRVSPDPTPSPPPPSSPPPSPVLSPSAPRPSRSSPLRPPADEDIQDCRIGAAGELGRLCDALLNVGGLRFRRWGCIGRGRCAIAAVELAVLNCRKAGNVAAMEAFCDERREQYANMLQYSNDEERKVWLQHMVDIGAGDDALGTQSGGEARNAVRRTLQRDLGDNSCNLGWEFLVLAAAWHHVNILLIPIVVTGQPMEALEPQLIPPKWDPQAPVIAIYHRAYYQLPAGEVVQDSIDTGGHYETLFCNDAAGHVVSYFKPGDDAWVHLRRLAFEVLARSANAIATAAMERYFNRNIAVRDFAVGDAVGVRTNSTKQRTKKRGVLNIPGLVVDARDDVRVGGATTGQRLYICLTKYGIIDVPLKVDGLTYLSANNHVVLFDVLRQHLSDGTWRDRPRVTVEAAVTAFLDERQPAAGVAAPRLQQGRAAKGAEDEEEEGDEKQVVEQGDVAEALPLSQAQSHPIRILRMVGQRYRVEWNDPPGEETWVSVRRWNTMEEYRDLVEAFNERGVEEA
jgi:hypothetical protein